MAEVVRAEIRGGAYYVGTLSAGTLPRLCVQLLKAGRNPEAAVECYREGHTDWAIRAKSIRAVAEEAARSGDGSGEGLGSPDRETRTRDASAGESGGFERLPVIHKRESLFWSGLKLNQRTTNRTIAIVKRDSEIPALFRVHLTDHISDLVNLARAGEAAIVLSLEMLNREMMHRRRRVPQRRKASLEEVR